MPHEGDKCRSRGKGGNGSFVMSLGECGGGEGGKALPLTIENPHGHAPKTPAVSSCINKRCGLSSGGEGLKKYPITQKTLKRLRNVGLWGPSGVKTYAGVETR